MQTQNNEKNLTILFLLWSLTFFICLYPVAETGFCRNMTCSWFYDRLENAWYILFEEFMWDSKLQDTRETSIWSSYKHQPIAALAL